MAIEIDVRFAFEVDRATDVMLQFEAAAIPEQTIRSCNTDLSEALHCARVAAQDDIGERIWLRVDGAFEVAYTASVDPHRKLPDLTTLGQLDPHDLPGEAVQYLMDSRYCPADKFQSFVNSEFEGTGGGARIEAIRSWIEQHFSYVPGSSGPETGALETFVSREGVCRDYSHVLVALARASTIPARYVSCFAPGVDPPDFHAVAEVFLADSDGVGGTWQIVDATGMATAEDTVKIGVGRDAADVSFLTSFGPSRLTDKSVEVRS